MYHFWVIHSVTKSKHYCQQLAKELGCHSYWTDVGKVAAAAAGVGVIAAAVVAAIDYWILSRGKTKDNKK